MLHGWLFDYSQPFHQQKLSCKWDKVVPNFAHPLAQANGSKTRRRLALSEDELEHIMDRLEKELHHEVVRRPDLWPQASAPETLPTVMDAVLPPQKAARVGLQSQNTPPWAVFSSPECCGGDLHLDVHSANHNAHDLAHQKSACGAFGTILLQPGVTDSAFRCRRCRGCQRRR